MRSEYSYHSLLRSIGEIKLYRLLEEIWKHKNLEYLRYLSGVNDEKLLLLSDDDVISLIKKSNDSLIFDEMFYLGLHKRPTDDGGDLKLCHLIAKYCKKNRVQVDRIFRRSALYNNRTYRWNRGDYARNTLDKSCGQDKNKKNFLPYDVPYESPSTISNAKRYESQKPIKVEIESWT
jgi:hypothetical protein